MKTHTPHPRPSWVRIAFIVVTCAGIIQATRLPLAQTCLFTRGYWQTHPAAWPVSSLILGSASNPAHSYTQGELLNILGLSARRDASIPLAGQLIAAKLNIANGSNPSPIAASVARADALFGTFAGRLPYGVAPNTPIGSDMTATARALEDYNRGLLPGSCGTTNQTPVANAGPDQTVDVGTLVTLNGGASSDPDGNQLSFAWAFVSQPADSSAVLSAANAVTPTFVADKPGTYEVLLVVNDGSLSSTPDVVRISTRNSPPTANAGPDQTRRVGELVQLDGAGSSDPDGDPLTFLWTFVSRPAGSNTLLSDPSAIAPSFTVDAAGRYELQLVVSDGNASSAPDALIVSTVNSPPVANAGADTTARVGETVTLDGSGSNDVDGNALTFHWSFASKPAGSTATLSDAAAVSPSFTVDVFGEYVLQLVVDDGAAQSSADTMMVSTINSRPVANAGADQTVFVGLEAQLDGTGSTDIDGNPLTYQWSLTSQPVGSTATLLDPTAARPRLVPDVPGTYLAQLTVNDGTVNSEPDTVLLTTNNRAPVANAGPDQTLPVGATAQLDGTGSSDPDGEALIFSWSLVSKPTASAAALVDASSPTPSFTLDVPGTYVAQLIVSDGTASSSPDSVTISTENSRPTADAGSDRTVETGATVQLDGSGSFDPDGTPLLFAWSLLSRPAGSTAELSNVEAPTPTLVTDVNGTYVVQLIVSDGALLSVPDTMTVTAQSGADLAIAFVNAPSGTRIPGTAVTFSVRVENLGPLDAADVGVRMQLPQGYTAIGIVPSAGAFDNATGAWTIGALAALAAVRLDVQATLNATGSLALAASITNSSRSDPDTSNNVAAAAPVNRPPVANAGSDVLVTAGATAFLDGNGSSDADGDQIAFQWNLTTRPPESTAMLSGSATSTPTLVADKAGQFVAELVVTDSSGAAASDTVLVTAAANRAPIITSLPVTTAAAAAPYVYHVNASDPDAGDTLTFSLPIAPAGMTIDAVTGLIQWTPVGSQTGTNNVAVHVRDRAGLLAAQGFSVAVSPGVANAAPTAHDDDYDARTGDALSVAAPGVLANDIDADGNRLSARALTQPANGNVAFNRDGSFVYTPFTFQEGELVLADNVNLGTSLTGTVVRASTENLAANGAAQRAVDGSLGTSWRTHPNDSPATPLIRSLTGEPPFIEVEFPADVEVRAMQAFGHRDPLLTNFKIFAGKFQLFDAGGAEIFNSGTVDLPLHNRDGKVSVPELFTRNRNIARTMAGMTYRASSFRSIGNSVAALAFDGNLRTQWESEFGAAVPQFLEVEFPADVDIHRVKIFGNRVQTTADFVAFVVQIFDAGNGALFDSGTISVTAASSDTTVNVGGIRGARRVRVTGTALETAGSFGGIAELEVITSETLTTRLNNTTRRARFTATAAETDPDGEVGLAEFSVIGSALIRRTPPTERNLAQLLPTAARASSFAPNNPPESAIDDSVRNWYSSFAAGEFLELEFPNAVTVNELRAANPNGRPDGFGTSATLDCTGNFTLHGVDGSVLFDSGLVNQPAGSASASIVFTLPVPDVAGVKRIRYTSAGCGGPPGSMPLGFSEIKVLGSTDLVKPAIDMRTKFHALAGRRALSTPLVVNLTDDNGDGRTDQNDVPEIIAAITATDGNDLGGEIKIMSGDDGRELVTLGSPNLVAPLAEPAVGDIDVDGIPEVIAVHSDQNHLIAFAADGAIKWVSDSHPMPSATIPTGIGDPAVVATGAVAIANLDGAGPPEIIVGASVFSSEGRLLGDGRALGGTIGGAGLRSAISAVADIDLDGVPELIAGPTAYRFAGGVLSKVWQRTDRTDGYVAIANLDDDPFAEIVIVGCSPTPVPCFESAATGVVYVLNHDGSDNALWNAPSHAPLPVPSGGQGGAPTIADLDGDGIPEIGVAGASLYTVFNRDGSIRWQKATSDRSSHATGSTVFDLDGDGRVEIVYRDEVNLLVLRGTDGVLLAKFRTPSATSSEMPVVADVDNDGHADIVVPSNPFFGNSETGIHVLQDVANRWVRTRRIWNQYSYHVSNVNEDGTIPVTETPHFLIPELNNFRLNALMPDGSEDGSDRFTYVASDGDRESPSATVRIAVRKPNSAPQITSTGVTDAAVGVRYLYAVRATDRDAGDIITFSLPTAPDGMSIDSALGLIQWTPTDAQRGAHEVVVKVEDVRGLYVLQGYSVQVGDPISVPDVVGTLQSAASNTIASASLAVGDVSTRHSPTVATDTVITQNPAAGSLVAHNSPVDLVVSLGPAPAGTVPDVVGQLQASAQVDIVAAGFIVGNVNGVHSATVRAGTVLSQTPSAGSQADVGSPIALAVSLGVPPADRDLDFDGVTGNQGDCNDTDATIHPGAPDVPGDGIDQNCNGPDSINGDDAAPVGALASPDDLAIVTMPVDIVGTATDANFLRYTLTLAEVDATTSTTIGSGVSAVNNSVLGRLDPTLLENGLYRVRLEVEDVNGQTAIDERVYQVSGEAKIGILALSFIDLHVPVSGIPITVVRSYDSRVKTARDFGVGWSLQVKTGTYRNNRRPGDGWTITNAGGPVGLPCSVVTELQPHVTEVRLSDREFYRFRSRLANVAAVVGGCAGTFTFEFLNGTIAGATLEVLGGRDFVYTSGETLTHFDGGEDTGLVFDPRRVRLTTVDGRVIDLDRLAGITRIQDSNSNTLTFSHSGVVHSSGKSIGFARDAHGRIVRITDPMGASLQYLYSGELLAEVIDQGGHRTTFSYDAEKHLQEIVDPLGNRAMRSEYDADGRLIAVVDGNGARTEFRHDISGREEVVVDALGHPARAVYDERGNILVQEKTVTIDGVPVLARSRHAYDANGNETLVVDPDDRRQENTWDEFGNQLSKVIDPGGRQIRRQATYTPAGDTLSETDPNGDTVRFTVDNRRNTTEWIDVDGRATTIGYDMAGQITSLRDPDGRVTRVAYDAAGRVVSRTDSLGHVTTYSYDASGNRLTETTTRTVDGRPRPSTVRYEYDALNRVTQMVDALGNAVRMTYDPLGRLASRTDQLGRATTYEYDALGSLKKTTYPDGTTEIREYDLRGDVVKLVDREGLVTRFEYDELRRLSATVLPNAGVARTIYSPGGQVIATIGPDGARTDHEYDAAGRRILMRQPPVPDAASGDTLRPEWRFEYDAGGRPTAVVDPRGHRREMSYDTDARTTTIRLPDGATIVEEQDQWGRTVRRVDAEGHAVTFDYLADTSRLAAVTLPPLGDGQPAPTWRFTYDEVGNRLSQVDPLGRITTFAYDDLGRVSSLTLPGGQVRSYAYSAVGRLTRQTEFDGTATQYEYDASDRLLRRVLADGTAVTFSYTPGGRRAAVRDARGATTYTYDAAGRLVAVEQPGTGAIQYTYDLASRVSAIIASGGTTSYTYDALGRLSDVGTEAGTTRYAYDSAGNLTTLQLPNGVAGTFAHDARNQLTSLVYTRGSTALASFAYAYTPAGRRASVAEGGATTTFQYDRLGRLLHEARVGAVPYTRSYEYDAAGNRAKVVSNGVATSFTYDVNDRLLTAGSISFAYDANGNVILKDQAGALTTYDWTPDNRLARVTTPAGATTFAYDADGIRVAKMSAHGTTRFLVDRMNPSGLRQVLEERDPSGTLLKRHEYGLSLLSTVQGGVPSFYQVDGQSSVRFISNAAGAVSDTYTYDAFGAVIDAAGATANDYLYAGQSLDRESDLYYMRERYYDPSVGRFLGLDPVNGDPAIPQSLHRYLYAGNDPVNFADPNGDFFTIVGFSLANIGSGAARAFELSSRALQLCRVKSFAKVATLAMAMRNSSGLVRAADTLSGLIGLSANFGSVNSAMGTAIGLFTNGAAGAANNFTGSFGGSVRVFKYEHPWAVIGLGLDGLPRSAVDGVIESVELNAKLALLSASDGKIEGPSGVELELKGKEFLKPPVTLTATVQFNPFSVVSFSGGTEVEREICPLEVCQIKFGKVAAVFAGAVQGSLAGLSGSLDIGIKVDAAFLPEITFSIIKLPDDFK